MKLSHFLQFGQSTLETGTQKQQRQSTKYEWKSCFFLFKLIYLKVRYSFDEQCTYNKVIHLWPRDQIPISKWFLYLHPYKFPRHPISEQLLSLRPQYTAIHIREQPQLHVKLNHRVLLQHPLFFVLNKKKKGKKRVTYREREQFRIKIFFKQFLLKIGKYGLHAMSVLWVTKISPARIFPTSANVFTTQALPVIFPSHTGVPMTLAQFEATDSSRSSFCGFITPQ